MRWVFSPVYGFFVCFVNFSAIFVIYIIMWITLWIMWKTPVFRPFVPVENFFMSPDFDGPRPTFFSLALSRGKVGGSRAG